MTRVLIIEKRMTHYRVPMFEKLRALLADRGVELLVGYGPCHASETSRNDTGSLEWATHVPTLYLAGGRICLQSFGAAARTCDLLVVTQENKLVSNLVHQFLPMPYKVAIWGHGANLQGNPHGWAEKWKRFVSRRADWWFAYTDLTLPLLEQSGFDMRKVTVLGNSIDTEELKALCAQSEAEGPAVLRARLGVPQRAFTGLYLGTFSPDKRIDFLLEVAQEIRRRIPDFKLILAGSGPEQARVDAFCQQHPWCHPVGQARGRLKSDILMASDLILNPGMVGLGILDAFVAGRPMLTTRSTRHSPEIAYLSAGVNGEMTEPTVPAYVEAVCRLHQDRDLYERMSQEALRSAQTYSIDAMAERFAAG
ncbi:MAG: hypothetical protein RL616_857, partial [Verrucomicrobiota bacterium]